MEPLRHAKATYGTGSFVLVHSDRPAPPGILRTAAALVDTPEYALEGSIFVTCAAVQWLRDGLGLLAAAEESEAMALSLAGNDGVYFVPALTGLGAPHWEPDARGLISGLTRGTRREHVVRAALEAVAYQTRDVLDSMALDLETLRADGGLEPSNRPSEALCATAASDAITIVNRLSNRADSPRLGATITSVQLVIRAPESARS